MDLNNASRIASESTCIESSSRSYSIADQRAFADLSCDYNPVHLDERSARRTLFGRPIVHGMHIALWMLDWFAATMPSPLLFRKLTARFNRPLFLNEAATIRARSNGNDVELQCTCDGVLLTHIRLSDPIAAAPGPWQPRQVAWSATPVELAFSAMTSHRGELSLPYQAADIARLFPTALKAYGAARVAHMLAMTRVVGMELPGLHSLFAGFAIQLHDGHDNQLSFSVARFNAKTSHLQVRFASDVLTGTADTFARPQAARVDYESLTVGVKPSEFSGRRSLIIGGSRGLGLVSAYLLSAGRAEVVVTYRVGREEAEAAVAVMRNAGGTAGAVALDVAAPEAGFEQLGSMGFQPTEVYYFATPHISERKKALFEPAIFERFAKCYVTDFANIVDACRILSPADVSVFYPSSEFLNHPVKELTEYAAAKAAGEAFCEMASQFAPHIRVLSARLPRLPTDQTAALMAIGAADPATVMLDVCRKMGPPAANQAA